MTATSAGSSSCLAAKGLDISLAALQRQDPYINNIVDVASQVALYTYNNRTNEWEKTEVEGTLFIYTRLASPRHGFTIMNRLSMENLTEPITKDLDFQLQDPFLLYRNARLVIHGIWFYDKEDCQRIAQRMKIGGGGGSSGVRGGGSEGKGVDIIQMLTKARTEYDKKSTSEPKEIGGSSVLYGNPNLIKPIPVKPTNTQDSEGAEPKSLSLATLFGSQHQHHHSSKPDAISPVAVAVPVPGSASARPPVARTLTYDDTLNSGRSQTSKGGNQHCPAIQKLMQGQRGVGGVLQTVSESPENRLCDNGVPLEHHHHHHHLYHHHHQQHHHHHHQQQQLQSDPIKRLFQIQPPPSPSTSFSSAAPPHNCINWAPCCFLSGLSSHMPGVVSPHELLQKLQLVQQEQSLASSDPPRLCPGLSTNNLLSVQVISPQRIPATVAPTMLLSPSVFTQAKPSGGLSAVSQENSPAPSTLPRPTLQEEVRVLSRSQLQATLLHLIQADSSFLDTVYEAYISRFANGSSSKY
uniref:5'-(N(7)-methylguanosine 5'-triphospho)-[mRNA] hydrolase n=1 Tax=Seriola lalandi dorsalis TaxID=1841481 RepID=A0A3B4X4R7_SERLL